MDNKPLIDFATYQYFHSNEFKIIFSTITRILEIAGGNGGVFWLEAAEVFINNCFFVCNEAYIGGVGYLWQHSKIFQSRIFFNSTMFYSNVAGPTSGVFNFGKFLGIETVISYCLFFGNKGKRKKLLLLLKRFYIYLFISVKF